VSDLYKEKVIDNEIVEVLVKKDLVTRKLIKEDSVDSVEELYNERGKIYKSRCVITTNTGRTILVKHPYEETKKLIFKNLEIKGF
jgi:hypothetical protein